MPPQYEIEHSFGPLGDDNHCMHCRISRKEAYEYFRLHGENIWCDHSKAFAFQLLINHMDKTLERMKRR